MIGSYFKFKRSWLRELGCMEMIMDWWSSKHVEGSATVRLAAKLKALRFVLKEYGAVVTSLREQRRMEVLQAIGRLDQLEGMHSLIEVELSIWKSWQEVLEEEDLKSEIDWRERSRQLWLAKGDASLKYFHTGTSARRRFNLISSINFEGQQLTSAQDIRVTVKYFKGTSRVANRGCWRWAASSFPCVTDV
jgi:hypothetical protein